MTLNEFNKQLKAWDGFPKNLGNACARWPEYRIESNSLSTSLKASHRSHPVNEVCQKSRLLSLSKREIKLIVVYINHYIFDSVFSVWSLGNRIRPPQQRTLLFSKIHNLKFEIWKEFHLLFFPAKAIANGFHDYIGPTIIILQRCWNSSTQPCNKHFSS